jgi:hypothetical protein
LPRHSRTSRRKPTGNGSRSTQRPAHLHLVAGTVEPQSTTVTRADRPGVVPHDQFDNIIAAFNGGFKAQHGRYGMMLDGQTFLPPRDIACTVGLYKSGAIRIGTWPALGKSVDDMTGYRQTPPCLVELGQVNDKLLAADDSSGWGAAVGGETVIRRSAIGVDAAGNTLFYALGDSVTAGALARAMKAAGAENAAQLDVNAAYPRFLLYSSPKSGDPKALPTVSSTLIHDIRYNQREYVGDPETRDFFYLTRKPLST